MNIEVLRQRLQFAMAERGMSLRHAAMVCHVSHETIRRILDGRAVVMKPHNMAAIDGALRGIGF